MVSHLPKAEAEKVRGFHKTICQPAIVHQYSRPSEAANRQPNKHTSKTSQTYVRVSHSQIQLIGDEWSNRAHLLRVIDEFIKAIYTQLRRCKHGPLLTCFETNPNQHYYITLFLLICANYFHCLTGRYRCAQPFITAGSNVAEIGSGGGRLAVQVLREYRKFSSSSNTFITKKTHRSIDHMLAHSHDAICIVIQVLPLCSSLHCFDISIEMLKNCRAAGPAHHTRPRTHLIPHAPSLHTSLTSHAPRSPSHTFSLPHPVALTRLSICVVQASSAGAKATMAGRCRFTHMTDKVLVRDMTALDAIKLDAIKLDVIKLDAIVLFLETHFAHRVPAPSDGYWREVCCPVRLFVHLRRAGAYRLVHAGMGDS